MASTHTYAILEISSEAYQEIADKMRAAGYDHAFDNNGEIRKSLYIDMHGIAIAEEEKQ